MRSALEDIVADTRVPELGDSEASHVGADLIATPGAFAGRRTVRQVVRIGPASGRRATDGRQAALLLGAPKRALKDPPTPTQGDS